MRKGYDEVVLLTGFPSFRARRMCEEIVLSKTGRARSSTRSCTRSSRPTPPRRSTRSRSTRAASEPHRRATRPRWTSACRAPSSGSSRVRSIASTTASRSSYLGADRGDRRARERRRGARGARDRARVQDAPVPRRALVGFRVGRSLGRRARGRSRSRPALPQPDRRDARARRAHLPPRDDVEEDPVPIARASTDDRRRRLAHGRGRPPRRSVSPHLADARGAARLRAPAARARDVPLNLVPIDFVTKAALHIGRDPRAPGRTFHLVDPNPLPSQRVVELVARRAAGASRTDFLPANLTRALLRTPGLERVAKIAARVPRRDGGPRALRPRRGGRIVA